MCRPAAMYFLSEPRPRRVTERARHINGHAYSSAPSTARDCCMYIESPARGARTSTASEHVGTMRVCVCVHVFMYVYMWFCFRAFLQLMER